MPVFFCIAIVVSLSSLGCTSQQAYYSGQSWQRNECNRIVDNSERERCLSNANTTYEDYKRQTEGTKKQ